MAVPRRRHSHARTNTKRAHHAKVAVQTISCPNCKAQKASHKICPSCGQYKGRSYGKKEEAVGETA